MAKTRRKRRRKKRYHTGVHVSSKTDQHCKYRSGWELKYMEWLDANPDVRSFLYEQVRVPYVSNVRTGKIRTYYPDFLVEFIDGSKLLVEVKPSRKLEQSTVKKKLAAAQVWASEHGATLQVLTEKELRCMGLL